LSPWEIALVSRWPMVYDVATIFRHFFARFATYGGPGLITCVSTTKEVQWLTHARKSPPLPLTA